MSRKKKAEASLRDKVCSETLRTYMQRGVCFYCQRKIETDVAQNSPFRQTWDHVVPRSTGVKGIPYNKVPACCQCNREKGAMHVGLFFAIRELKDDDRPDIPIPSSDFLRPPQPNGVPHDHAPLVRERLPMFKISVGMKPFLYTGCNALDFCRHLGLEEATVVKHSTIAPSVSCDVEEKFARMWFPPDSTHETVSIDANVLVAGEVKNQNGYVLFSDLDASRIMELFIYAKFQEVSNSLNA